MAVTLGLTEALIGTSTSIERVRNDVDSAVRSKASVLITGEPGVGKAAIAREIHDRRGNPNLPFFRVDCQDGQDGSRAFKNLEVGHRPLPVDVDDGSPWCLQPHTLYLANIDALSEPAQASLLRFLETGSAPFASTVDKGREADWVSPVDIRVVTSATPALLDRLAAGTFREDLFYRLNVIHLIIPPLRERAEDIPVLLQHFVQRLENESHHGPLRLPEELQAKLESYDWPGNINELRALASYLVRPTRSRPAAFASSHRRSHAVQGLGMTDALHNPTR